MYKRGLYFLATAVAVLALLFASRSSKPVAHPRTTPWPGRNNTALFLTNSENGFANVLLATSHALLQEHPDIELHLASFPKLAPVVDRLNKFGSAAGYIAADGPAPYITFHSFIGPSFTAALQARGSWIDGSLHPPGLTGLKHFLHMMRDGLMPWSGPEYLSLYHEALRMIKEINPLVVAVDPLFGPGLDAVRASGRNHVIISPNALKDKLAAEQPWGAFFWKYPAMSSGYPYPLPIHLIPNNIYLSLRFIYFALVTHAITAKRAFSKQNDIEKPVNLFSAHLPHLPWISQSLPEIDFPVSVIPENVIPCGPIYLSVASAEAQDPALAEWVQRAPTVLINLGSNFNYDEEGARQMAKAVKMLLDKAQVQVLWKVNKRHEFDDDYLRDLQFERIFDRLRLEGWLPIDPATLLETGHVTVSVHHGGAGCYHEAVGTGVPQLILPFWADLYDYARRVEYLGIGIYGNKRTAPNWTAEELGPALLKMVGGSEEAVEMRRKAKELAAISKRDGEGRVRAAREVAKLARRAQVKP